MVTYQFSNSSIILEDKLADKPFWIQDRVEHDYLCNKKDPDNKGQQCCFNHIIGLPTKNNQPLPLFDYEIDLLSKLQQHRHLFILKARGLGITEFMLRYMAWMCVYDNTYANSQMCIIVGPNIYLAKKLIKRMKDLFFNKLGILFETDSNQTSFNLNGVDVGAYPSNNINAYRSLTNPSFILVDEGDFFVRKEWSDIRDTTEGYAAKSNPIIVLVSTPNKPGGMFDTIEREPEQTCFYYRMRLGYQLGLGKIYSEAEIEELKRTSESFDREFNLQYLGKVGNVFNRLDIDTIVEELGRKYNPNVYNSAESMQAANITKYQFAKSLGADPGFSSSAFGLCVTQYKDGMIEVLEADDVEKANYEDMVMNIYHLIRKYNITRVYIDGSNPAFIRSLNAKFGLRYDETKEILSDYSDLYKYAGFGYGQHFKIVPVNFMSMHKRMLGHLQDLVSKKILRVNPKFEKLIISLRTAYARDLVLDKEQTSYPDILDALRLNLLNYPLRSSISRG
jgi:hypothetical protein